MIKQLPVTNRRGFTLLETIIYVGLFGIMFTGIFISIYPFFTGAERLSRNIATEGETAFVLNKIHYALAQGITSSADVVTTPAEGATADKLIITQGASEHFRFEEDLTNTFCTPPLICKMLVYSENGTTTKPLNAERVLIENFSVTHTAPNGDTPRYLDISFTANGVPVGPVRYYLHF
jgi:type II secretory pathway pseudopilin PulG